VADDNAEPTAVGVASFLAISSQNRGTQPATCHRRALWHISQDPRGARNQGTAIAKLTISKVVFAVLAVGAGAVDQPVAGPGGDQRGQLHALVVAAGHPHLGAAAAAPGAAPRRPQALAGLVLEAEPGV
jgi:hypothetical protein